jgi:hypothetical protein
MEVEEAKSYLLEKIQSMYDETFHSLFDGTILIHFLYRVVEKQVVNVIDGSASAIAQISACALSPQRQDCNQDTQVTESEK